MEKIIFFSFIAQTKFIFPRDPVNEMSGEQKMRKEDTDRNYLMENKKEFISMKIPIATNNANFKMHKSIHVI